MCGIAGIVHKNAAEVNETVLKKMTDSISHRGPDGEGHWINSGCTVGLGHRRLSIIDLSNAAGQPMHYMSRYSIIFNGEIYNYVELKAELLKAGYAFQTASDTEVLIAYYDWKKEKCLDALDGMFAFAIYDNKNDKLFCARDRFGEKPLFYHYKKGTYFYFASEMKALWAAGIPKQPDPVFIYNYITGGFVVDPSDLSKTFYSNIQKLEPSQYLELDAGSINVSIKKYWDIDIDNQLKVDSSAAIEEQFRFLMKQSVERRLRSDVPVGSSLSGGLDSSLIVLLINEINNNSNNKVQQNTFSARFPGFENDEGKFIDIVTKKANVIAHSVVPGEKGFINEIDNLFYHQEEPFGSASIYAQYCVMKLAKENNITVLLDGQGADEILGGYHIYFPIYFNELKKADKGSYLEQKTAYEKMFANTRNYKKEDPGMLSWVKQHSPIVLKYLKILRQRNREMKEKQFNKDFFSGYRGKQFTEPAMPLTLNAVLKEHITKSMQTLLRYADRNSMSQSREVRLPYLSPDLVSFLFSLPASFKLKDGWTKSIMRRSFEHLLPEEIAWRKDKVGFEPPQKDWMENKDFKDMIMSNIELLVKERILDRSMMDKPVQSQSVNDNSQKRSWQYLMAGKLMSGR